MTAFRMTDEEARAADAAITAAGWAVQRNYGVAAYIRADWLRARASEVEKDIEIARLRQVLTGVEEVMSDSPAFNQRGLGPSPALLKVRAALKPA